MELRFNPLLRRELLQELDIRLEQSFACMETLILLTCELLLRNCHLILIRA
ncbi:hypothetical protein SAMN04488603_103418 [Paenibacillus sp. cl130]|nr:hypothetical protein SAMN04488603_103418 [Paenibacillus sp. cl130]